MFLCVATHEMRDGIQKPPNQTWPSHFVTVAQLKV